MRVSLLNGCRYVSLKARRSLWRPSRDLLNPEPAFGAKDGPVVFGLVKASSNLLLLPGGFILTLGKYGTPIPCRIDADVSPCNPMEPALLE